MRSAIFSSAMVALAAVQLASAQTFTDCNPTEKTCPSDTALGRSVTVDFTKGQSSEFTAATGTTLTYGSNGAEFTINTEAQAPTINSNWYLFFGTVEVTLQAAPGVGIVSSFVLESDDLDEIDWEWLGGDAAQVESNYFGKGNTTTYDRAIYHPVSNPQTTFHTYKIDWTSDYVKWYIDGSLVRTLNYADANGGQNFPQTPMKVKMGNWVGGGTNSPAGTVSWAGGYTNFALAPFTMYVKSVTITDAQTGASSYTYGDLTGSWQSIKIEKGGSFITASGSASLLPASASSSSSTAAASSTSVNTTVAPSSTLVTSTTKSASLLPITPVPTNGSTPVTSTPAGNSTVRTGSATLAPTSQTPSPTRSTSGVGKINAADMSLVALVMGLCYVLML